MRFLYHYHYLPILDYSIKLQLIWSQEEFTANILVSTATSNSLFYNFCDSEQALATTSLIAYLHKFLLIPQSTLNTSFTNLRFWLLKFTCLSSYLSSASENNWFICQTMATKHTMRVREQSSCPYIISYWRHLWFHFCLSIDKGADSFCDHTSVIKRYKNMLRKLHLINHMHNE